VRYLALGLVALATLAAAPSPVDRVHVFAGTSNSRWQLFPGATVPFGMVKLSPDNQGNVWNGGYEYTVGSVAGFSHLHAMGLSGLSLMPVIGPLQVDPTSSRFHTGAADGPFGGMWTAGYRSRIDKATETGSPGYYGVTLLDYGVKAELTATTRVGLMRLTWPKTTQGHLFIDFDFPTEEKTEILGVDFRQTSAAAFEAMSASATNMRARTTIGSASNSPKPRPPRAPGPTATIPARTPTTAPRGGAR